MEILSGAAGAGFLFRPKNDRRSLVELPPSTEDLPRLCPNEADFDMDMLPDPDPDPAELRFVSVAPPVELFR